MRGLLCCVVVGLVAGVAGCSAAPPGRVPSAPASSGASRSSGSSAREFCEVALPEAWRSALADGRITHAAGESLVVNAVADDGSSVFADSYHDGVREVVWLRGARRTTVMRLADPDQQVFGAAFDGRWLVFSV